MSGEPEELHVYEFRGGPFDGGRVELPAPIDERDPYRVVRRGRRYTHRVSGRLLVYEGVEIMDPRQK